MEYIPQFESPLVQMSAGKTIEQLAQRIRDWEAGAPQGKHLVVTMRTPDGRIMDVGRVAPEGFSAFTAEGNIEGMPCMIAAHISNLCLFLAFDESKGSRVRPGFTVELRETPTT